jgi:hypothetical protein
MALTTPHPLSEAVVNAYSDALFGSPGTVAFARVPFRGKIVKVGVVQSAAVTGTATVTTAINGTAVTGGGLSVTGGSADTAFTASPTALNAVAEDDVISFSPTGATGAGKGHFFAVIRRT